MDRETIKIKTPIGKQELVLKAWLTGGEKRDITNSLINGLKVDGAGAADLNMTSDLVNKSQDAALEIIIISIDGETEDIVKTVLDMRSKDFDYIVEEINKITTDEELKKE